MLNVVSSLILVILQRVFVSERDRDLTERLISVNEIVHGFARA